MFKCEVPTCSLGINASLSNAQFFKSPGRSAAPPAYSPLKKPKPPVTQRASRVEESFPQSEVSYNSTQSDTGRNSPKGDLSDGADLEGADPRGPVKYFFLYFSRYRNSLYRPANRALLRIGGADGGAGRF